MSFFPIHHTKFMHLSGLFLWYITDSERIILVLLVFSCALTLAHSLFQPVTRLCFLNGSKVHPNLNGSQFLSPCVPINQFCSQCCHGCCRAAGLLQTSLLSVGLVSPFTLLLVCLFPRCVCFSFLPLFPLVPQVSLVGLTGLCSSPHTWALFSISWFVSLTLGWFVYFKQKSSFCLLMFYLLLCVSPFFNYLNVI